MKTKSAVIAGDPFETASPATVAMGYGIANRINSGESLNVSYGRDEMEPSFHSNLVSHLYKMGFTDEQTGSYCSKASGESHLIKDNLHVEVVSANFLGFFTQVQAHRY